MCCPILQVKLNSCKKKEAAPFKSSLLSAIIGFEWIGVLF
jgi:hypothetical protein